MAIVIITKKLEEEISKKFKHESVRIIELMKELELNPKKGKEIGVMGKVLIKELKYNNFRFYFITDGYKLKFLKIEELKSLVIKFIRMSNKDNQQTVIEDIKRVLRTLGEEGF
jgi:hypothetical protein